MDSDPMEERVFYRGAWWVRADVVEGRVREAVRQHHAEAERRLTAKYHAALPAFVRNPQNSALWPMTSLRAAQECAERARWEEREACAALCQSISDAKTASWRADLKVSSHLEGESDGAQECADAIRTRPALASPSDSSGDDEGGNHGEH